MSMARKKKPDLSVVGGSDVEPRSGNKPSYKLKMRSSDMKSRAQSVVGVGWPNTKGGVNIKLNPGVVLSWRDMSDSMLTLWPVDDEDQED